MIKIFPAAGSPSQAVFLDQDGVVKVKDSSGAVREAVPSDVDLPLRDGEGREVVEYLILVADDGHGYAKKSAEFERQGGRTEPWGETWRSILAIGLSEAVRYAKAAALEAQRRAWVST